MTQRENKNKTRSHTRTRIGSTPMHVQTLVNKDFNRRPSEMERDKKMNDAVIGSDSNPAWDETNEQQPELDKAAVDVQQIIDRVRTADPASIPAIATEETLQALRDSKKGQILRRGRRVAGELEDKGLERVEDLKKQLMSKESAEKVAARRLTKELGNLELDDIIRLFGDVDQNEAKALADLVRKEKISPNDLNSVLRGRKPDSVAEIMSALGGKPTRDEMRQLERRFSSRARPGVKGKEKVRQPGQLLPATLTDEQMGTLNAIRARRGAVPLEESPSPRDVFGNVGKEHSDLMPYWDLATRVKLDKGKTTGKQRIEIRNALENAFMGPRRNLASQLPEGERGTEADLIQRVLRRESDAGFPKRHDAIQRKKDMDAAWARGEDPVAARVEKMRDVEGQLKPIEQAMRDMSSLRIGVGDIPYQGHLLDDETALRADDLTRFLGGRSGQLQRPQDYMDAPKTLQETLQAGQELQNIVRTPIAFQRGVQSAKSGDLTGTGLGELAPKHQIALDEFVEQGRTQKATRQAKRQEAERLREEARQELAETKRQREILAGVPQSVREHAPTGPVGPPPTSGAPPPSPGGADVIDIASRRGSRVLDDRELAKQPGMLRTEADLDEFMTGPGRNVDDALTQKNQQLDQTAAKVQDTEQRMASTGGPLGAGGKPGADPTPVGATPPQPDETLQPKSNFARNALIGSAIAVPAIGAGAYGIHRFNQNLQRPSPQPQAQQSR